MKKGCGLCVCVCVCVYLCICYSTEDEGCNATFEQYNVYDET